MSPHDEPLAECLERYKRFEDKIDSIKETLISLLKGTDKINVKFEEHILEGLERIKEIERHRTVLEDLLAIKLWFRISTVSIVIAIVGCGIVWGSLKMRVDVNTGVIQKHSVDIDVLKEKSYGYRDMPVVTK